MAVTDFRRKFAIVARALERENVKVLHKHIAAAVYPDAVAESAYVMWSECKAGRRGFPESKLVPLLAVINKETGGLLTTIEPSLFLGSWRDVERAFISAGLIDTRTRETLSETLLNINSVAATKHLLSNYPATREATDALETAFYILPDDKKVAVVSWFCEIVESTWISGKNMRASFVAGYTLFRAWPWLKYAPEMRRLSSQMEGVVSDLPPKMALLSDPIASIGSLLGSHGAFRAHVKRLVDDAYWRDVDYSRHLRYHHGLKKTANSIKGHLLHPTGHGQVACEDIGTLICIYPSLIMDPELADLAQLLRERMLNALKYADVEPTTCRRAEAMLVATAS